MPARITAPVTLTRIPLYKFPPFDVAFSPVFVVGGKWRVNVTDIIYEFDPAAAISKGKTNFVNPARTYPLDGNIGTTGAHVTTYSTSYVDADFGVDLGAPDFYLIFLRIGHFIQGGLSVSSVALFGSADMTTWTMVWGTSTGYATEQVKDVMLRVRGYRAFKLMHHTGNGSYYSAVRTYEFSAYRIEE